MNKFIYHCNVYVSDNLYIHTHIIDAVFTNGKSTTWGGYYWFHGLRKCLDHPRELDRTSRLTTLQNAPLSDHFADSTFFSFVYP
jgi:hypothetical protein